jgi:hypothetical protein
VEVTNPQHAKLGRRFPGPMRLGGLANGLRLTIAALHYAELDKFNFQIPRIMRWLLSFTVAFVWTVVVQAKSFTGSRLLVVLEEPAEREKYSVFLEDLNCKLRRAFI